jgi:hypothetical protein
MNSRISPSWLEANWVTVTPRFLGGVPDEGLQGVQGPDRPVDLLAPVAEVGHVRPVDDADVPAAGTVGA